MATEIERELLKCEAALYEMQKQYPALAKTAAQNRYVYDVAWANAIDEIAHRTLVEGQKPPTVPVQDAMATKIVAEEMEAARTAEADLDAAKKHIDTLQAILSSAHDEVNCFFRSLSNGGYFFFVCMYCVKRIVKSGCCEYHYEPAEEENDSDAFFSN